MNKLKFICSGADGIPDSVMDSFARMAFEDIMAHRVEILRAFVAKYGVPPDQVVQVIVLPSVECKEIRWFVRKMTAKEVKELKKRK